MTRRIEARRAIELVHERWLAAERDARIGDMLELCDDEIVVQPPIGRAVVGRDAVAALLRDSAGTVDGIETSGLEIDLGDSVAIKRARFSTRLAGSPELVRGTHLWILRPAWRIAFITWSLDSLPGSE